MWEHRNDIKKNTMTPAKLGKIADMDRRIQQQFTLGRNGLLPRNLHWLNTMAKVLRYDIDVKAQWLTSINLARKDFLLKASSIMQQCELNESFCKIGWPVQHRSRTLEYYSKGSIHWNTTPREVAKDISKMVAKAVMGRL
jgi:hypothetical protein